MSVRWKCVLVLLQVRAIFWRQADGSPSSSFTATTAAPTPTTSSISFTKPLPPLTASPSSADFVERFGHQLISRGRPFRFLGCNAYWLAEDAMVPERRSRVDRAMKLAKGLGLRVLRLWAFNHRLPALGPAGSGLVWAEDEFVALDYVVRSAELYGMRLVLALGNFWPAYVAPELFLRAADITGGNLTVADFYSSPAAREMYKQHIAAVTSRVNVFSGVSYRDSPNIMMWDVINEPRCPGCSSSELSAFKNWMYDMASYTKTAAPRQLVSMGTEGFFGREPYGNLTSYVSFNPGAGSVCEGEDWIGTSDALALDVAVVHTYWRQTEGVPSHDWTRMSFEEYLPWYMSYTWLHVTLAGALGKPLVQEEFNILSGRFTVVQRRQLFAVALAQLQASAAAGGPYAGALWWSCALQGSNDDGYNVYIDVPRPPKRPLPLCVNILPPTPPPPQAAPPPPTPSPPSPEQVMPPPPGSRGGPSIRYRHDAERGGGSEAQEQQNNTTVEAGNGESNSNSGSSGGVGDGGGGGDGGEETADDRNRRRSLLLDESSDPFLRVGPRAQCAEAAAARWRPALPLPLEPDLSNAATVATTGLDSTQVQQLLAAAAAQPSPSPSPSPPPPPSATGVTAEGSGLNGGVEGFLGDGELLNLIADAAAALNALSE